MPSQGSGKTVVSAASFVITLGSLPGGPMAFSELDGINSKVDATEYIESDPKVGEVVYHTKQFGKTSPPIITLKRGLDGEGNGRLLAWHELARSGNGSAASSGSLDVYDAAGMKTIGYLIQDAWCQELTISGVKAGDSAVATITVKIACTHISAAT